jgi:hypothetical protein
MKKLILHFLKENWLKILPWIVILVLSIITHSQYREIHKSIPAPPVDNRIDSLRNVVALLNADLLDARHDYDSAQKNIKVSIITIREQNAKDVSNISNYSTEQRDSAWSTITFP